MAVGTLRSYTLLDVLGQGGAARVFRAVGRNGEVVAVKVLTAEGRAHDPAAAARFVREAELLGQVKHPNVLALIDQGVDATLGPYIIAEMLEGRSLRDAFAPGALCPEAALMLVAPIAEGLAAVHAAGIVHRDIKAENVVITREGRVVIVDFGLAYAPSLTRYTVQGSVAGSVPYMSPEQIDDAALTGATDVWSLGVLLYELIAGIRPFHRGRIAEEVCAIVSGTYEPLVRVDRRASEAVSQLVATCLQRDPTQRPSGAALARDVKAQLDWCDPSDRSLSKHTAALVADTQGFVQQVVVRRCRELTAAAESMHRAGDDAESARLLDRALAYVPADASALALVESITGTPARAPTPAARSNRDDAVDAHDESAALTDAEARSLWVMRLAGVRDDVRQAVAAVVAPFGGRLTDDAGADMTVRIVESGVRDRPGTRAARCALAVSTQFPQAHVVLTANVTDDGATALSRSASVAEETQTAAHGVFLDDVAAELLAGRFDIRTIGRAQQLRAERDPGDTPRLLLGRAAPFVGRERDLSRIVAMFDECAAESVARALVITAAAGIGKSRLCGKLIRELRSRAADINVWVARGDPMSAGSSFGMAAQLLRRRIVAGEGDRPEALQTKLRVALNAVNAPLDPRTAFLAEILRASFADTESAPLAAARRDPALMNEGLRTAFVDWLTTECSGRTTVIVLDDLQWGDLPTVEVLDRALRVLRDRPLLVIAFARPELHEVFPRLWADRDAHVIPLGPLSRRASTDMIRDVLGANVDGALVERVVQQAQGHPFYLEELIRAFANDQTDSAPAAMVAMVRARLEALDADARRVLRAASIFGQAFWDGSVQALIDAPGRRVDATQWLDALAEREFVDIRRDSRFAGQREYGFRHAIVRDAAYSMLTEADRQLGHKLAGNWLQVTGETDPVALGEHFDLGGARERAADYFRQAAVNALQGCDVRATLAHVERAVAYGPQGHRLGQLRALEAEARWFQGENSAAERAALEAMQLLDWRTDEWGAAATRATTAANALGHDEQLDALRRTLRQANEAGVWHKSHAGSYARMAIRCLRRGQLRDADELLTDVEAILERYGSGSSAERALVMRMRSNVAVIKSEYSEAISFQQRAAECSREIGDERSAWQAEMHVAVTRLVSGEIVGSVDRLRECVQRATRVGLEGRAYDFNIYLAWALMWSGRLDEAEAVARQCIATFHSRGVVEMGGVGHQTLARVLLARGDASGAEPEARMADDMLANVPIARVAAIATLARTLLAQGRAAEALSAAERAMQIVTSVPFVEEGESEARLVYVEALRAVGRVDEARRALGEAKTRLLERAQRITEPERRIMFLTNIPDNARTLTLASAEG